MTAVELDYASLGSPGAARVVVLLREGATALTDPAPAITHRRDARIVMIRVDDGEIAELGGSSGMSSARATVEALGSLLGDLVPEPAFALVGVGSVGEVAVRLAGSQPGRVDRLVLVAAPMPGSPLDRDALRPVLAEVDAKTLILNGQRDPDAAAAAAEFHRAAITAGGASARVEMVPASADTTEPRLGLSRVWERVLSFGAPGATTRA